MCRRARFTTLVQGYQKGGSVVGLLIVLCLLLLVSAQAQTSRFDVQGVVTDSTGASLPGATVVALTRADSILTKFATTNRSGAFVLRRLPEGDYILQATFVGYQTLRQDFSLTDADVDMGTLTMQEAVAEFDELVVSADHIPFVVTRDTLSYNAAAFATRPNAVVEDLLRQLPGIVVEEDGTITAQGEEVQNVLVEGKEFFGSDPTITTKNLPADAVERVDVYDKPSDRAEFTGIPDGEEEKTINLALKEGAKQGYFGRVSSGFGGENTDQSRYDADASINRFTPATQLALIANINNVNQPGFAWGDFFNFVGGAKGFAQEGGRGNVQIGGDLNDGYSETLAIGLNASHDFSDKTWIRSSYFLSSLDNTQDRVVQQQQLVGSDLSALLNQVADQSSENLNHQFNLNAQATFAEGHDLRLRGNFAASTSQLFSNSFQDTHTAEALLLSTALTNYATEGDNLGGNAQLTWRKKISDNGRSLVGQMRVNLDDNDLSDDLTSTTNFYKNDLLFLADTLLQTQSQYGQSLSHTQRLSLTEPLGEGRMLEIFGERSVVVQDHQRAFFDIVDGQAQHNTALSTGFDRTYTYWRGGGEITRKTRQSWFTTGIRIQVSDLQGTVAGTDEDITQAYTHFLPWLDMRISLDEGKHVRVRYAASTREPSLTELQPFTDNSDPLHSYTGNPSLTPEYRHTLQTEYRFFDQFSFVNLFTALNVTYTHNQIVLSRTVDEQLVQAITSVNAGSGWTANSNMAFGAPLRPIGARLDLRSRLVYTRGLEVINDEEHTSRIVVGNLEGSLSNRDKAVYDLRIGGNLTFNRIDYTLNDALSQDYTNHTLFASIAYYPGYAWTISAQVNHRVFDEAVFGTGQNITLIKGSVSRLLLQERGEIQLTVFDMFNQNQGINFTNTATYIQEERIASLGRYLMLKFIYRLSGFGTRRGGHPR